MSQTSNFRIFHTCYGSGYGDCATHHGGLSDYIEYLIAQCTEFAISRKSLSFSKYNRQGDP